MKRNGTGLISQQCPQRHQRRRAPAIETCIGYIISFWQFVSRPAARFPISKDLGRFRTRTANWFQLENDFRNRFPRKTEPKPMPPLPPLPPPPSLPALLPLPPARPLPRSPPRTTLLTGSNRTDSTDIESNPRRLTPK